jgi:hypothetical protein
MLDFLHLRVFLGRSLEIVGSAEQALGFGELLRIEHVHLFAQVTSLSLVTTLLMVLLLLQLIVGRDHGRLRGLSSGLNPCWLPNIFTLVKRFAFLDHGLWEAALELGEDARLHVVLGNLLRQRLL